MTDSVVAVQADEEGAAARRRPAGSRGPSGRARPVAPRFAVLLVLAAISAFPLYWMLATALSTRQSLTSGTLPLVPWPPTVFGLRDAIDRFPVGLWFTNSLAIVLVAVPLTVVVDVLAGFVLAKYRFPGRTVMFLVIVGTLMIPIQVLLLPQFDVVNRFGWINTYWAVIVPRAAEAFGVFLARQYMLSLPDELLEAAAIDGAGPIRTLTRIVLPLCRPLVAVLVVLTFMYRWNEFAWPLVALRDPDLYTMPVGLAFLQGQYGTDYPTLMGGALLSTLPVLIVFALAQRQFVEGIARSGLR